MPFLDSHAATGKGKGKGGVFGIGKGKDANTAQREHSATRTQRICFARALNRKECKKKRFVPNKRCLARGLFQSMFFLGAVGHGRGDGVTKSAAFCNGAGRFVPSNALFWLW